jgi:hypothetical protein
VPETVLPAIENEAAAIPVPQSPELQLSAPAE